MNVAIKFVGSVIVERATKDDFFQQQIVDLFGNKTKNYFKAVACDCLVKCRKTIGNGVEHFV